MKKITLNVDGREMSFSEQELTAIVKKHLSSDTTSKVTTTKVVKKPTEGEWFEVKPQTIDKKLFEKERKDTKQELTRQLIIEAFAEMENNPEKYAKNFKTMIPKNTGPLKNIERLKEIACELGDHQADWVEQALEWAQRIANGEEWKTICNYGDTANWYRIVVWKNGCVRLVGGSINFYDNYPVSFIHDVDYYGCEFLPYVVPLIVCYE